MLQEAEECMLLKWDLVLILHQAEGLRSMDGAKQGSSILQACDRDSHSAKGFANQDCMHIVVKNPSAVQAGLLRLTIAPSIQALRDLQQSHGPHNL